MESSKNWEFYDENDAKMGFFFIWKWKRLAFWKWITSSGIFKNNNKEQLFGRIKKTETYLVKSRQEKRVRWGLFENKNKEWISCFVCLIMEERERERDTVTHTKITNSLMKNNSWILLYIKKKEILLDSLGLIISSN